MFESERIARELDVPLCDVMDALEALVQERLEIKRKEQYDIDTGNTHGEWWKGESDDG